MVRFASHGPFGTVPADRLFPGITPTEEALLRAAAHRLDAARPDSEEPTWWWSPEHVAFPGPDTVGVPLILSTTVGMAYSDQVDWTELELDVSWTPTGFLTVGTSISVACWCRTDHNTHYVKTVDHQVSATLTLGAALDRAVTDTLALLAGPVDPAHWRARYGLPQRSDWPG